jgi:hypothetical protein
MLSITSYVKGMAFLARQADHISELEHYVIVLSVE